MHVCHRLSLIQQASVDARVRTEEPGQTVFVIARHSELWPACPAGLLRDSPVLSCARRVQRPSDPQVFDQFVANGIKQLPYGLVREIRGLYMPVSPYKANVGGSIPSAPTTLKLSPDRAQTVRI